MSQSDGNVPRRGRKKQKEYIPPSLGVDNFVTQPPKPAKGLTGKISTLFRREASRERTTATSTSDQQQHGQRQQKTRQVPHSRQSDTNDDDDEDDVSTTSGVSRSSRSSSKRIFYSSNADDDSDDSYESRVSPSAPTDDTGDPTSASSGEVTEQQPKLPPAKMILRYRGFSTSIQSLFLDEPLVCASMGCFGLILGNRTEYLLQIRNERRGSLSPRRHERRKLPSKIVAYGLVITVLLMFSTFVIWGFGTGNGLAGAYYGYDYYDENDYDDYGGGGQQANNNNNAYNDDQYVAQGDDWLSQNEQYYNNQYKYNNDDNNYNNNNDDYNANNDDGGNNYNQNQYNQNQYNNNQNNNYNQNQYNQNQNYDDQIQDDYYEGDDGGRRMEEVDYQGRIHKPRGVLKIRDYQENLWNPVYDFVMDEWYRPDNDENVHVHHHRRQEETNDDDDFDVETYQQAKKTRRKRDLASNLRIAILFAFLLFLGVLGRRRRMRTRFYVVRARAQEDHLYYASSDIGAARRVAFEDTREDQYEGACSHTLCGCYPIDELPDYDYEANESVEVTDAGIFRRKTKPHHEDIVARGFKCLMAACCGSLCKCWFQCLSICALAQEAREIRLLVPPRYQRVDFITHQPFHEYQTEVNNLRRGWLGKTRRKAGYMPHWNALSRLSRYILLVFSVSLFLILATLLLNPRAAFSWQDAVVLIATFLQSFLVLFVVHWIFHKSDLSLDAVIKLFGAGFLIAVPSAFFFEGLLVNVVLLVSWCVYSLFAAVFGNGFVDWIFEHWRMIWIFGELFNAYVVAAVTEELCKYYTFRCVEHPDLVFLTGLNRNKQDKHAIDGGLVQYPFTSHQVQQLNRDNSFETSSVSSHRSSDSRRSRRSRRDHLIERTGTREDEFDEDETDVRTYRQKAMAITTGMISVAVGLACAENFIYVFLLGGAAGGGGGGDDFHADDIMEEWAVLFFRSIFPIHALAAALQSINMIRKFVETDDQGGHRIGVGRIIFPAVILHGSFDAVLMGINVFVETAWDKYLEENDGNVGDEAPYNAFAVNCVALISISAIMMTAIVWYYRENRNQSARLKLLEEKEKARLAEDEDPASTWSPKGRQKEIV